jgi:hypothetical protein
MYAEYFESENGNCEFAITFERSEKRECRAYITGLPVLEWDEQVRSESARK